MIWNWKNLWSQWFIRKYFSVLSSKFYFTCSVSWVFLQQEQIFHSLRSHSARLPDINTKRGTNDLPYLTTITTINPPHIKYSRDEKPQCGVGRQAGRLAGGQAGRQAIRQARRQADRQDMQADRQDRQAGRRAGCQAGRQSDRHVGRQTGKTGRQTGRTGRQAGRRAGWRAGRQADRHAGSRQLGRSIKLITPYLTAC